MQNAKCKMQNGSASHFAFCILHFAFDMSLFPDFQPKTAADAPLPERLRPSSLAEVVGLHDLLDEGRFLRNAIESDRIPSMVFIDEIHRFNKAQQDAFLPYVETGDIVLIGATTENPSFEVNSALLSRCKVVVIPQLEREEVMTILRRAVADPSVQKYKIEL